MQEYSTIAFTTVQASPRLYPFVPAFLLKVSSKIGASAGQPSGITDLPRLNVAVWSTRRVRSRLPQYSPKMSSLSVLFLNLGVVMSGLEEVTTLFLKSQRSPSVRQCTFTFCIWKYLEGILRASVASKMVTPCSPNTFPCPFSQKKEVFSSSPTPMLLLRSDITAVMRPILPRMWKCVSKTTSNQLNPGILPALSSYCTQSVPFLMSERLVPLTAASGMVFGARPQALAKQMTPQGEPQPQVLVSQIIEPAELPDTMISSFMARFLIIAKRAFYEPSSFNHDLTCFDWSPPAKNKISAKERIYRFFLPRSVAGLAVYWQLSAWTEICCGAIPNLRKMCWQLCPSSSSSLYTWFPQASVQ